MFSVTSLSVRSNQSSSSQSTPEYERHFDNVTQELRNNISQLNSSRKTPLEKIVCFESISRAAKNPEMCKVIIQDTEQNNRSFFGASNKVMIFTIGNQEIARTSITDKEDREISLRSQMAGLFANSDPYLARMISLPENSFFSPNFKVSYHTPH